MALGTRQVPTFPHDLAEQLLPSQDVGINSIEHVLKWLNDLAGNIPPRYGWRFRTVDAFNEEIAATARGVLEVNSLYWTDMMKPCEAYSIMSTWRVVELARNCVQALERKELVCAALLARAGLESTAQFVDASRAISVTLETCLLTSPTTTLYVSEELEAFLLKAVFGSRLEGDEIYRATNILTILGRIANIKGQEFVTETYAELCEIAHPNFAERSVYVLAISPGPRPGDEIRTIGLGDGLTAVGIMETVVKALSWFCGTHVSAFGPMSSSIRSLLAQPGIGAGPVGRA